MSRCRAAPRRVGFSPTGTIPDSAAATSTVPKNGVLPSSTPTWGGSAGSSLARSAAARSAPAWMWSRQLVNTTVSASEPVSSPDSIAATPWSSTSVNGSSREATVGSSTVTRESGWGVCQLAADVQ